MKIVKIEPGEKYILVMPDATASQVAQIAESFKSFREDDMHVVFFIHGVEVGIVPASQVVGYKTFGDDA